MPNGCNSEKFPETSSIEPFHCRSAPPPHATRNRKLASAAPAAVVQATSAQHVDNNRTTALEGQRALRVAAQGGIPRDDFPR